MLINIVKTALRRFFWTLLTFLMLVAMSHRVASAAAPRLWLRPLPHHQCHGPFKAARRDASGDADLQPLKRKRHFY